MELRRFLDAIRRRWWIGFLAFAIATAATCLMVLPRPPVYESKGTFVLGPRAGNAEESVRGFDTLIRGESINATYASIASSDLIRSSAEEEVDPLDTDQMTVSAEVLTGTNILSISVQGPAPGSTRMFALAVTEATVSFVDESDEAYKLEPLDAPKATDSPVGPNKMMTIAIGMFLGAFFGLGLIFVVDYLASLFESSRNPAPAPRDGLLGNEPARGSQAGGLLATLEEPELGSGSERSPSPSTAAAETVSESPFGTVSAGGSLPVDEEGSDPDMDAALPVEDIYTETTLGVRLALEIRRAGEGDGNFSFGLMTITEEGDDHGGSAHSWIRNRQRIIASVLRSTLRDEDVIGLLDDGRIAVVLRDQSAAQTEAVLLDWQSVVDSLADCDSRETPFSLRMTRSACEFVSGTFSGDQDAIHVARTICRPPNRNANGAEQGTKGRKKQHVSERS
ncbi:MAG: hypothetical protein M3516_10010 [Actinomycetota bacterium]|nr:hypothetical protein [Actinomycetota bacterium]